MDFSADAVVGRFQEFIRIESISFRGPDGSYREAARFLRAQCEGAGLVWQEVECVENKPIGVATLAGTRPDLPALLLNCHYDVVPVDEGKWTKAPFGAEIVDGKLYGRGTQDMKSVVMQYIEAMGRLIASGVPLLRTVHLTFMPDEEIGGTDGLDQFIRTPLFKSMRVGMALDEGLANPNDAYTVFYGERTPWWLMVEATGAAGHGSRFVKGTAMEKLLRVIAKFMQFREDQEKQLGEPIRNTNGQDRAGGHEGFGGCRHCVAKKLGDVVTVNLTALKAGVTADGGDTYALNCIPTSAVAGFDMRVPPNVDLDEMRAKLDHWCGEDGVSWKYAHWTTPLFKHHVTVLDEAQNMWWKVFSSVFGKVRGVKLEEEIFPAATDSRFIRKLGIPCFGFSPMRNTPVLLHDHDEYVHVDVYLEGVGVYVDLVTALANTPTYDGEKAPMDEVLESA